MEAGIAVIVACLPTLNFLLGKRQLTSLINSIRSAISLESIRSNRSRQSHNATAPTIQDNISTSSQAQIVKTSTSLSRAQEDDAFGVEAHAMVNLEARPHVPPGKIFVQRGIESSSDPTRVV